MSELTNSIFEAFYVLYFYRIKRIKATILCMEIHKNRKSRQSFHYFPSVVNSFLNIDLSCQILFPSCSCFPPLKLYVWLFPFIFHELFYHNFLPTKLLLGQAFFFPLSLNSRAVVHFSPSWESFIYRLSCADKEYRESTLREQPHSECNI